MLFDKRKDISEISVYITDYLEVINKKPKNLNFCVWELAKYIKNGGKVTADNISELIDKLEEDQENEFANQNTEISEGNLSQTMRDLYRSGHTISEIAKKLNKKYVRVKNVIKKLPEYKDRAASKNIEEDIPE